MQQLDEIKKYKKDDEKYMKRNKNYKKQRFDLYWLGEIKEDIRKPIASSKTLIGIRQFAKMNKLKDHDHIIYEIVSEFNSETIVEEYKIRP